MGVEVSTLIYGGPGGRTSVRFNNSPVGITAESIKREAHPKMSFPQC